MVSFNLICLLSARLRYLRPASLSVTTSAICSQRGSSSGVPTATLRPGLRRPVGTALVACTRANRLQAAGGHGISCVTWSGVTLFESSGSSRRPAPRQRHLRFTVSYELQIPHYHRSILLADNRSLSLSPFCGVLVWTSFSRRHLCLSSEDHFRILCASFTQILSLWFQPLFKPFKQNFPWHCKIYLLFAPFQAFTNMWLASSLVVMPLECLDGALKTVPRTGWLQTRGTATGVTTVRFLRN